MGDLNKALGGFFEVAGEKIGFGDVKEYAVADGFADVCAVQFVQEDDRFFVFFLDKGVFQNFKKEEVVA